MLVHYFTIARRHLLRYKLFTFINLLGITLGITACLLIFLLIRYEQAFDQFHQKSSQLYRVHMV